MWLVAAVRPARGAETTSADRDDVTVSVLTFGPGDHPFFKFGHNAIWVQPRGGRGVVYNFGTFAFDTPNLIGKFLRGRFTYWLSRATIEDTLWSYQASDRTIVAQELDLAPAQAQALWSALEENAKPANRAYLYDYFWDNCSTRVRDAVDRAVGGRLHAAASGPARLTFRRHALRLTADLPWEYVGLDVGLGSPTDAARTEWEEDFIPEVLQGTLRKVTLDDGGVRRPLVRAERVVYLSTKPPPPSDEPGRRPVFALAGVLFGAALYGLGALAARARAARVALGGLLALLGLALGVVGLALPLLWAFTNHRAAFANANILQIPPWAVLWLPLGIGVALGSPRVVRAAFVVAAASFGLAFVGLLLKILPGVLQENGRELAFALPFWFGLTAALARLRGRRLWPLRARPDALDAKPSMGYSEG